MTRRRTRRQRLLWMAICVILLVGSLGGPASAQIYEWLDANNVRHFANSLDRVPDEARVRAQVVVNSQPSSADTPPAEAAPSVSREEDSGPPEDDAFASGWQSGFDAGWDAAMRARDEEQPECPAQPQVIVLESRPPVVVNAPYDPTGAYYQSPYGGTITVPFDFGASRGLTHRAQIQDMRTLERGW